MKRWAILAGFLCASPVDATDAQVKKGLDKSIMSGVICQTFGCQIIRSSYKKGSYDFEASLLNGNASIVYVFRVNGDAKIERLIAVNFFHSYGLSNKSSIKLINILTSEVPIEHPYNLNRCYDVNSNMFDKKIVDLDVVIKRNNVEYYVFCKKYPKNYTKSKSLPLTMFSLQTISEK